MAEKNTTEIFYVNIRNSHNLRRGILETSKEIIECLQRFEKFKNIRAQKIKAMEDLIIVFRDINDLTSQIKVDLPKVKLPTIARPDKKKKEEKKNSHIDDESEDELKKLENAIAQIESRLGDIK